MAIWNLERVCAGENPVGGRATTPTNTGRSSRSSRNESDDEHHENAEGYECKVGVDQREFDRIDGEVCRELGRDKVWPWSPQWASRPHERLRQSHPVDSSVSRDYPHKGFRHVAWSLDGRYLVGGSADARLVLFSRVKPLEEFARPRASKATRLAYSIVVRSRESSVVSSKAEEE